MDISRAALLVSNELQNLTNDLAALGSYRNSKGTIEDALQRALAHSIDTKVKAHLSVILEGIGDAFYALDQHWRFTYINRAAESYFGIPRQEMLERVLWDIFPNSRGTELKQRYEEVCASGVPASFEADSVGMPGRYLEFHVFPYNGGLGVSFRDWTERRRIEEELRESEARLSSLADNVPACMVYQLSDAAEFQNRRLIYLSKTCERLTGVPAEEVQANPALLYNLVLPEYRERMLAMELEAYKARKSFDMEIEMWHARTGEIRWHRLVVTPRLLSNGSYIWDALQVDITDHKRAEEHLRLMINELNHRVKNTLATVQSLAAQSFHQLGLRGAGDLDSARSAFEARLFALARGHDVLTRENWESASLADVIDQACAPYRNHPGEVSRIEAEGPDLRVTPSMVLSLSMALHELCTNALKYGSLGASGGGIRISWSVAAASTGPRLNMRWEEHGGPPVTLPTRTGFGSRLIQYGLARELNGTVRLVYDPGGVVCTIDVPLS
jgi:PAS domain S-box-containing protein